MRKRGGNWSSTNCWNSCSQLFLQLQGEADSISCPTGTPSFSQSCPRAQTGTTVPWTRDSLTFNKIKAARIPVKAEAKRIFGQQSGSLSTACFFRSRAAVPALTLIYLYILFLMMMMMIIIIIIKAQCSQSDWL